MVRSSEQARYYRPTPEQLGHLTEVLSGADEQRARQAFELLYQAYSGMVYSTAYAVVRRTEVATEIRQQVFQRTWEQRHTFEHSASISGWLRTVSHRLALDHIRRKSNQTVELPEDEFAHSDDNPEAQMITQEEQAQWQAAKQRLATEFTSDELRMLNSYYQEGKTIRQITLAEAANDPTVNDSRVHRLLVRYKQRLREVLLDKQTNTDGEPETSESVVALPDLTAERIRLSRAIDKVAGSNTQLRSILQYALLENWNNASIAEVVGKTTGAIASILSNYKPKLAQELGGNLIDLHSTTPRLDKLIRTSPDEAKVILNRFDSSGTLIMHMIDGLSGAAIAKHLGEKPNTIQVRILRGKAALEEYLAKGV